MPGAVPFVADWNNDGRKDLIVGQANGFVILFLNTGLEEAPEFAAGTDLYAGSSALYVGNNAAPAVIDYNGDGAKDLMVGNAAGQIAVYLNQGSDAAPVLAATAQVLAVRGNAPMPVDWDADGENDLVVTDGGDIILYTKVNGEYQLSLRISEKKSTFSGAFAIDLAGVGKSMLAGDTNGELVYLYGNSKKPVAAFYQALQDKVDELGDLVADVAPQFLGDVAAIRSMISTEDMASAKTACETLASAIAEGRAQVVALELAALCTL
jgi:hypothetical protein